jgi:hypothetical protein
MTEKKAQYAGVRWQYALFAQLGDTIATTKELNRLGADGWEAYAVLLDNNGERVHFFKRPIAIDPPPDGGRAARPAPIDPPPDGG